MAADQRSGCNNEEELSADRKGIKTDRTSKRELENNSSTSPNEAITSVKSKTARHIPGEHAMKYPLNSFIVALRKPMGMTVSYQVGCIRVSAIKPGGPADKSGKVVVGNVLLAVNGHDVGNESFRDVLDTIQKSGPIVDLLFSPGSSAAVDIASAASATDPAADNSINNDAGSAWQSNVGEKHSSATPATKYTPPTICVGEKIMKFFTNDFYEGKLERLPTKGSSLFFVVYSDGDREEMDEDGFWSAYSDYRVQKGITEPSEFVPDSLVVANDGRLATVRSFRPVSNGNDTTWSYRVHFTGWSATFDKWMLQVDLRKQTKSTLKWAEKVRASLGIKDRSKKKVKIEKTTSSPVPKVPTMCNSRTATSSATSTLTKRPAKATKAKSISVKSIGCDVVVQQYQLRSSEPHFRRAAVDAKRKLSTPPKEVPKKTRKVVGRKILSSKPTSGDKKANVVDHKNYILPKIDVGTSILKYFTEGRDYFEGTITKLPTPGKMFYRILYRDGDEEDMDQLELFRCFSDWCVANNEIPLTKVRNAALPMVRWSISFVWPMSNHVFL